MNSRAPATFASVSFCLAVWALLWSALNTEAGFIPAPDQPLSGAARSLMPAIVFLIGLFGAFVWRARIRAGSVRWILLYGIVGTISAAAVSPSPSVALPWAVAFLAVPLIMVAFSAIDRDVEARIVRTNWWICSGIVVLLLALAVANLHLLDLLAHGRVQRLFGDRPRIVEALLITSGGAGRFAAVLSLLALARILDPGRGRTRAYWAILLAPALVLLVYTISRTAIIALVAAAVLLVYIQKVPRRWLVGLGALAALVVVAFARPLWSYFGRNEESALILSLTGRTDVWANALQLAKESPIVGWGFHADRILLGGQAVHDGFLLALLVGGLVGLGFFVMAWFSAWRNLVRLGLRKRFSGLPISARRTAVDVTAVLAFLTVRSVTESTAAFFGVDLLLAIPCFGFLDRLASPSPAARPAPGVPARRRVLVAAFACRPPASPAFEGGEDLLGWNLAVQAARFHDVWVLTDETNRPDIEAARGDIPPGLHFEFVSLPARLRGITTRPGGIQLYAYLWQWRSWGTARRLHRRIRFDLFHHVTYANDWMASIVGALLPVPYLRGPGGGTQRVPPSFLKTAPHGLAAWEGRRSRLQRVFRLDPLFRFGQRRAARLLLCNRESLEAVGPTLVEKAEFFPVNGISADDLAVGDHPKSRDSFTVVVPGRLLRIKGTDLAIRAFGLFSRSHPDASLRVAGEGPERSRLEALVRGLGIEDSVRFLGWIPRPQVLQEMASAHAVLFPSLRDGGGAVVVEAMAVGTPVVCLDLAGPGTHVTPETGHKVEATGPTEAVVGLAKALETLAGNPAAAAAMGKAARRRAAEFYEWNRLGDRLAGIYQEIVESGDRPPRLFARKPEASASAER